MMHLSEPAQCFTVYLRVLSNPCRSYLLFTQLVELKPKCLQGCDFSDTDVRERVASFHHGDLGDGDLTLFAGAQMTLGLALPKSLP